MSLNCNHILCIYFYPIVLIEYSCILAILSQQLFGNLLVLPDNLWGRTQNDLLSVYSDIFYPFKFILFTVVLEPYEPMKLKCVHKSQERITLSLT